jgi:hypothetical protein
VVKEFMQAGIELEQSSEPLATLNGVAGYCQLGEFVDGFTAQDNC